MFTHVVNTKHGKNTAQKNDKQHNRYAEEEEEEEEEIFGLIL
jgi:hypothetical protein